MSAAPESPRGDPGDPAARATEVIAAINGRDPERLAALLAPDAEIATGRSVHAGPVAIVGWAGKEYDHLSRRYAIDETRAEGPLVLALGSVQYVWTEGGEVADESPIALLLELEPGGLRRLTVHDDARAALAEFEARRPR